MLWACGQNVFRNGKECFLLGKKYNLPIKLLQLKADPVEAYMKAPPALVFKGGMGAES